MPRGIEVRGSSAAPVSRAPSDFSKAQALRKARTLRRRDNGSGRLKLQATRTNGEDDAPEREPGFEPNQLPPYSEHLPFLLDHGPIDPAVGSPRVARQCKRTGMAGCKAD